MLMFLALVTRCFCLNSEYMEDVRVSSLSHPHHFKLRRRLIRFLTPTSAHIGALCSEPACVRHSGRTLDPLRAFVHGCDVRILLDARGRTSAAKGSPVFFGGEAFPLVPPGRRSRPAFYSCCRPPQGACLSGWLLSLWNFTLSSFSKRFSQKSQVKL